MRKGITFWSLVTLLAAASAGFAELHRIAQISGQWITTTISTQAYVSLAQDATLSGVVYGARSEGGVDSVRLVGGSWIVEQISPHGYVSITRDATVSRAIYGARSGGGLDRIAFNSTSGVWDVESLSTASYTRIAHDATITSCIYGAREGGGLDQVRFSSGWITTPLNTNTYVALVSPSSPGNCVFGARQSGGLDRVYSAGASFNTQTINNNSYCALSHEPSASNMIYAARVSGGVDRIYFGLTWSTQPVDSQTYSALASSPSGNYSTYGAGAGGLARVYYPGTGSWTAETLNSAVYESVVCDRSVGVVYGADASTGVFPIFDISGTKSAEDGEEVSLSSIVTAIFVEENGTGGYAPIGFAIEDADRSAGIRVISDVAGLRPGSDVSVSGITATVDGERVVQANLVTVSSTGNKIPMPYLAASWDISGGPAESQGAMVDDATASPARMSVGPGNVGLLMTLRGRVTAVVQASPTAVSYGDYFYVDDAYDATGIKDGSGHSGVRCRPCVGTTEAPVMPQVGDLVEVTGAAGVNQVNGVNARYLWTAHVAPAATDGFTVEVSEGWNLLSLPAAPVDADPLALFAGYDIDGNLYSWTASTGSLVQMDLMAPEDFGPITATRGYWLKAGFDGTISYSGYADTGPSLDWWLPVHSGRNLIGMPATQPTTWADWMVLSGTATVPVTGAAQLSWLDSIGYRWSGPEQSFIDFGVPGDSPSSLTLRPASGHVITAHRKLGLATPPTTGRVLVVDQLHPRASNHNAGTQWAPILTIGAAVGKMKAGDTLYVKNGAYREHILLPSGTAGAIVSMKAWPGHEPVMKGSNVVTGSWTRLEGAKPIYWTSWTNYTQMCFVNGIRYTQIGPFEYMSPASFAPPFDGSGIADMRPATFFYDSTAKRLYVWMHNGDDPTNHTVEPAVRCMAIRYYNYTHIDGITAMHCQARPSYDYCAIGGNGSWNTVENCKALHNEHVGIWAQGTDSIVRNCEMGFNGNGGFRSAGSERIHLIGNYWYDNSWRGYKPGWEDSTKVHGWVDCSFIGNRSKDDLCGIWVDVGSRNVLIADNLVEGAGIGIYYEISRWGIIVNNILRSCYAGVNSYGSDVLISNNVFDRCYVGGGVYSTMRQEPLDGYPPYYPGNMCLMAMRNNMWVNNVVLRKGPDWYDWSGLQENAHAGNNEQAGAYPAEYRGINLILGTSSNPNVNPFRMSSATEGGYWAQKLGATYDYRLLEGHLGGGKAIPATLTSVYNGANTPMWESTICDAAHPEHVYEINGTYHYRAQPIPTFLDICDISSQPSGDRGINFTWQQTGEYPRF